MKNIVSERKVNGLRVAENDKAQMTSEVLLVEPSTKNKAALKFINLDLN